MTYIDGFVVAVPTDRQQDYRDHAAMGWPLLKAGGATRMCECWGDDVPHGTLTDFHQPYRHGRTRPSSSVGSNMPTRRRAMPLRIT